MRFVVGASRITGDYAAILLANDAHVEFEAFAQPGPIPIRVSRFQSGVMGEGAVRWSSGRRGGAENRCFEDAASMSQAVEGAPSARWRAPRASVERQRQLPGAGGSGLVRG